MSAPAPTRPQTRSEGWRLGTVAGAPVVVRPWTVLGLLALSTVLVGWAGGGAGGLAVVLRFGVAYALVLAVSVFSHEVAHALVGRALGMRPVRIELTIWGGNTSFATGAETPGRNALVALAGPAVNGVLALVLLVAVRPMTAAGTFAGWVADVAAYVNVVLAVFNVLPGLPLDGGSALSSLVWRATGDRLRGILVAGWAGRVLAVVSAVVLVSTALSRGSSQPLLTVVMAAWFAMFLWTAASAAITAARRGQLVEGLTVASVGRPAVAVGHDASVAFATVTARGSGAAEVVVVSPDGRPAALVDGAAAASVPPAAAPSTPISAVSVPLVAGAVVDADLLGEPLLQALAAASRVSPVIVALRAGQVVAVVRTPDVVAALQTGGARR